MFIMWHMAPLNLKVTYLHQCICTFLSSLILTVFKGAGPPGTPRWHLTVNGTGDVAQLGPVGDRPLTQPVLHWTWGCAYQWKGKKRKWAADAVNLLHFDPLRVLYVDSIFNSITTNRNKGHRVLIYFGSWYKNPYREQMRATVLENNLTKTM